MMAPAPGATVPPLTPSSRKPGTITSSVTRPSTHDPATAMVPNRIDPAIETANGRGWARTLIHIRRTPRRASDGAGAAAVGAGAGAGAGAVRSGTDIRSESAGADGRSGSPCAAPGPAPGPARHRFGGGAPPVYRPAPGAADPGRALQVRGRQAAPGRLRPRPHRRGGRGGGERPDGGRDLPLLRPRHAGGGPQPGVPARPRVSPGPAGRRGRRRRRRRGLTPAGGPAAVNERIRSGGLSLAAHLARPPGHPSGPVPAVVLCHGYPSTGTAVTAPESMPELADRIATEMGWAALAFAYRGCGESEGQFSLGGWLEDIAQAVAFVASSVRPLGIWLAGFGTGGGRRPRGGGAPPPPPRGGPAGGGGGGRG